MKIFLKGNGSAGTWQISVLNHLYGLAQINSPVKTFTYPLELSSFTPNYSGVGGGVRISVYGTGFSANSKILVDDIECPVLSFNHTYLICVIPSNVYHQIIFMTLFKKLLFYLIIQF